MSEKTPLTLPTAQQWSASGESIPSTKPTRTKWRWAAPLLVSAWLITRAIPLSLLVEHPAIDFAALSKKGASCPSQPEPLLPKIPFKPSGGYRKGSAKLLSEAVQIATESFDDNGLPTEDPRWAPFFDFQKWLVESFPLVHSKAKLEYVNTLGIVLTLEGTDPSLKPLVLMSHYDVVPAPASTADRWTHGMFSGYIDDDWVWGRGAADDKTLLVAQYEALTDLLSNGFEARRSVIFSHGFDEEEVGKRQGAGHIAPFLEERYGKDGILLIIDEGTGVTDDVWGAAFATPSSREKGYADVKITVGTPGGHSSVPPEHTSIGIMSQIVRAIERNPFKPTLTPDSPLLGYITCAAKYSPDFPKSYAKLLKNPKKWKELAGKWATESRATRAILSTTQAVDIISGGVKVNALPEKVEMLMNFRIDFASSVKETQAHLSAVIADVADEFGFDYAAFGGSNVTSSLYITSELFGLPLEPSPDTPEKGPLWEMFAGTIRGAIPAPDGSPRIVSPYSSTGNTDTKVYWNLSRNIYRFMSANTGSGSGVHTVDEKTSIDGHLKIIEWVHAIIQNVNDYDGPQ